jgi:hypothetical protein
MAACFEIQGGWDLVVSLGMIDLEWLMQMDFRARLYNWNNPSTKTMKVLVGEAYWFAVVCSSCETMIGDYQELSITRRKPT